MDYIALIERVIKYIELHLEEEIDLDHMAVRENFSTYYFHRMFSAIVGESFASYIRNRRLNASVKEMKETSKTLTKIAMMYNFSSQSSFIRSFKSRYSSTPNMVRSGLVEIKETEPPDIVKRSIMNFNSDLVTKFKLIDSEEIVLQGLYIEVDLRNSNYKDDVRKKTKSFLSNYSDAIEKEAFQVIFDCQNSQHTFEMFIGVSSDRSIDSKDLKTYVLPSMLVAEFDYEGDLLDVGDVIGKDLMRWSKIAKKDLHNIGISAIHKFDANNSKKMFKIIIPIEKFEGAEN